MTVAKKKRMCNHSPYHTVQSGLKVYFFDSQHFTDKLETFIESLQHTKILQYISVFREFALPRVRNLPKYCDKAAHANSVDPDQIEQSDLGLQHLPFCKLHSITLLNFLKFLDNFSNWL